MSIEAIGADVERHRDGTITVRASIVDSDLDRSDSVRVTGLSLEACRAQLQAEVEQRAIAARDLALRAAVVGRVLASSQAEP